MANQMKLGYRGTPVAEILKFEGQWRSACVETLLKVPTPLTRDVVSNKELFDPGFDVSSHRGNKCIIRVYIPDERRDQILLCNTIQDVYLSPR